MLESFLVKLQAFLGMQIYQNKKRLQHKFFCEVCETFENSYFEEHLRTTASKLLFRKNPHCLNKMRFIDIADTFHQDRSSHPKLFCKNRVFKNFTKFTTNELCWGLILKKAVHCRVLTRDSCTVIFCEFYKISKNTYFKEPLRMAAYCLKINHLPRGNKRFISLPS